MEITIEIGTETQRKLIHEEISYVLSDFKSEDFEIVIPSNFDKHVQEKLNDDRFDSNRLSFNQLVMGKLIGENHIALNPLLYTESFNEQIRSTTYLHEYRHISNKKKLKIDTDDLKDKKLISLLNFQFDEYSANRFAFDKTKELYKPDELFESFYKQISESHFENLTNPIIYKNQFDKLVSDFQTRQISILDFVGKIEPIIERYSVELVSCFSIADSLDLSFDTISVTNLELIELFRRSYKTENYSFKDKICNIEKYLRQFGLSIENHEYGLYYNVFGRE